MAEVVRLEPFSTPPGPAGTWWRLVSRGLGHLVSLIAAGVLIFAISVLGLGLVFGGAFLSMGPTAAYLGPAPTLPGIVPFGALPLPTRVAYAATLVLDTVPILLVLLHLRALLGIYAAGRLLGEESRRRVTRIAGWLGAYAVAPLVGRGLVLLVGHAVDRAWFDASEIHALILAAVLLLFAQTMEAGHEAEQDRNGFV